jgi:hypothetical protein
VDSNVLFRLHKQWVDLTQENDQPQRRGYLFEALLGEIFEVFDLSPRRAFKLLGEQIDGSFEFNGDTYLAEAKWQNKPTAQPDLLVFRGKVESKSTWSRGVFVSYNGFSNDALVAFGRGRATNIIGIDGQDFHFILSGKITLPDAIAKKTRRAAETGDFFTPLLEFL